MLFGEQEFIVSPIPLLLIQEMATHSDEEQDAEQVCVFSFLGNLFLIRRDMPTFVEICVSPAISSISTDTATDLQVPRPETWTQHILHPL